MDLIFSSGSKDRELCELKQNHRLALDRNAKLTNIVDETAGKHLRAEEKASGLLHQNTTLEQELRACKEQLQACKDDLFRMQPTSHVPDSKIAGLFEDLGEGICTWINAEVSRYSDKWAKRHPDIAPKLFSHGGDRWMHELLHSFTESIGEHVIRLLVQHRLYKSLLNDKIYLFGLGKDCKMLQLIENEMAQLEPPRDARTIRAWRSETLTSVVASSFFSELLGSRCGTLAEEMFEDIEAYFPIIKGSRSSLRAFYEKVIEPAVKLALAIQTSPTSYSFEPRMIGTSVLDRCILGRKDLANMKVIDVASGRTLKADSPVVENEHGAIGEQVLLLTPSLWRCVPGEKPMRLTQRVLLAQLYFPLQRRRASTLQPRPQQAPPSREQSVAPSSPLEED